MKKKYFFFLLVFFLICLTGCKGKVEEDAFIKDKLSVTVDHFVCDIKPQEIKEFSSFQKLFISEDGKLYKWDKNLLENGKHCEMIDSSKTFKRFINGVIIDNDENMYFYINNQLTSEIPQEYTGAIDYTLYNKDHSIFQLNQNFEENDYDFATSAFYMAKIKDKNVIVFDTENGKQIEKVIGTIPKKEKVIMISDNLIKTDKAYYFYGKTNKKKCLKNSKVECLYGLTKAEDATHYYKIINNYSGGYLVLKTKDGIYSMKTAYKN